MKFSNTELQSLAKLYLTNSQKYVILNTGTLTLSLIMQKIYRSADTYRFFAFVFVTLLCYDIHVAKSYAERQII